MSVQVRQRLPNRGCGPTDLGRSASNREIRVQFSASLPIVCSRGLTHDDASVLTKRSGLDSRREFQWAGGVTDEHSAVRRRRPEFNSRPACHFLLLTVLENNGRVEIEFSNDTQAPLRLLYHAGRRSAARSGERYVHVTGAIIYGCFEGLRHR